MKIKQTLCGILAGMSLLLGAAGCTEYASAGKYSCERNILGKHIASYENKQAVWWTDEPRVGLYGGMTYEESLIAIKECDNAFNALKK